MPIESGRKARAGEPVRIVGVRYLNSRPLLAGLEAGIRAPFDYEFSAHEPSACAARLATGEAVAGLVPVAALSAITSARLVGDLGIACRGEVTSVLLVSRVPIRAIRTLAAHTASRTSIALARLLLAERWGARPEVVPATPPLAAMLRSADAAVIIGDPALAIYDRTGMAEIDLSAAWLEWTGLPFVFAAWAALPTAPPGIATLLERSLAHARDRWDELVPAWAAAHEVCSDRVRRYLGEILSYRLGAAERAGLAEFLTRATAAGLLLGDGRVPA